MKRFVYAAGAVGLTGVLVLLAMAVAQRDARVGEVTANEADLPYANQAAKPISIENALDGSTDVAEAWPPLPTIVRGNDSDPVPLAAPPRLPPARASLTSYSANQENANPSSTLAEPPPLRELGINPSGPAPTVAGLQDLNASPSSTPFNPGSASLPVSPRTIPALPTSPLPASPLPTSPLPSTNSATGSLGDAGAQGRSTPNALESAIPQAVATFGAPTLNNSNPTNMDTVGNANPALTSPLSNGSPSLNNPMANSGLSSSSPSAIPSLPQPSLPTSTAYPTGSPSTPSAGPTSPPPSFGYQSGGPASSLPSTSLPPNFSASSSSMNSNATSPNTNARQSEPMPTSVSSRDPRNDVPYSSEPISGSTVRTNGFSSAAPGGRQLDGSQNPSMEIQKRAPNEVQVGIPATFTLLVRNVGNASAFDVQVIDSVPKGAKLVRTTPQAQQNGPDGLVWKLGEMAAGAEQTLTIELIPETEGEIGSVASVNFAAQASVRTMSTQPKLVVKQLVDSVVMAGDSVRILFEVSNVGTGTARDVKLQEDVPQNLRDQSGAKFLERTIGDLAPGESDKFDIELTAVSAGKVANVVRAVATNAQSNESSAQIEVVAPNLQASLEGPRLRYLERQATYTVGVTNSGTAMATNVDLILYLPSGLQFNSTENHGEYIPSQHAVMWQLSELPAGKTAASKVTLLPIVEGDYVLRMQSQADAVRAEPFEKPVRIEGQSELAFSIEDDNDPIEQDGKTTYLIKLTNIGTRVDNDIEVSVELPEGSVVEQVDAPVQYRESQRVIQFAPIPQLQSKDQQLIRLSVRHTREGTHVVRARVKSKLREVGVIKEESTQVYRDQ